MLFVKMRFIRQWSKARAEKLSDCAQTWQSTFCALMPNGGSFSCFFQQFGNNNPRNCTGLDHTRCTTVKAMDVYSSSPVSSSILTLCLHCGYFLRCDPLVFMLAVSPLDSKTGSPYLPIQFHKNSTN